MNLKKALRLSRQGAFIRALATQRVAAAVEHTEAIGFSMAAALVDIGANKGQFSLAFHVLRPGATIIAFEPLPEAGDTYQRTVGRRAGATLHRVALADHIGEAEFFVTDRSDSSSLLKPSDNQFQAFQVSEARTMTVPVRRLSDCVDLAALPRPVLVKIDVQGAELEVLKGCDTLEQSDFVYVELSFVELYENQPLYGEVAAYLAKRGFELAGVFNQMMTDRFGPTQADFLFRRTRGPGR